MLGRSLEQILARPRIQACCDVCGSDEVPGSALPWFDGNWGWLCRGCIPAALRPRGDRRPQGRRREPQPAPAQQRLEL